MAVSPEYQRRLEALYSYIQENLSETITSESAAQAAGFSQFHFHRLFKSLTGESLWNCIKRIRLENSAKLLNAGRGKMSITDVALACGFSSSSVFSRAFKAHFSLTPSQWQKSRICKEFPGGFSYLSQESYVKSPVKIEKLKPLKVAYTGSLTGYSTELVESAFFRLYEWAKSCDIVDEKTQFIGIGLDDPTVTAEDKCRYLNAVQVPDTLYMRGTEVSFLTIPGGSYAVLPFCGKRDEISDAYRFLCGNWLPESSWFPGESFAFEWYRKPPAPDGTLTFDIYLPLQ